MLSRIWLLLIGICIGADIMYLLRPYITSHNEDVITIALIMLVIGAISNLVSNSKRG